MPTPLGHRLTVPNYKPATVDEHFENWRAIERMVNDLPFPNQDGGSYSFNSPYGIIAAGATLTLPLYNTTLLPNGWVIRESGKTQCFFTVQYRVDTSAAAQEIAIDVDEITVVGPDAGVGINERHPVAPSLIKRHVAFQGNNYITLNTEWKPEISITAVDPAGPDIAVETIAFRFIFFPDGLWGRFWPYRDHNPIPPE